MRKLIFLSQQRALLPVLTLLLAVNTPEVAAQQTDAQALNWVPKSELTPEQAARCPVGCKGAYLQPAATNRDSEEVPASAAIEGLADYSQIDTREETALLEGNVEFSQGYRQLRADKVLIDRDDAQLQLQGSVRIQEPGILLVGDSAEIDVNANRIQVENAQYLLPEQRIRGSAARIERSPTGGISIDNATYTACEPGDNAWVLAADDIRIDEQSGRATTRGVTLKAGGIPVFYTPWFQFIVDDRRASGLLYPEIGYSTDEGFKYAQPYYLNLAPNQDLTLTPRLASKRGLGLEGQYRLLNHSSYSDIAGVFFPDDDVNPVHSDNRWAAAIDHRGQFGAVTTRIDLQSVSDDDFLDDWNSDVVTRGDRDIFLQQHARIATQAGNWQLAASTTGYQNLIDDRLREYRELPRISALGTYRRGDIETRFANEWTRFDLTDNRLVPMALDYLPEADGSLVEGSRLRADWSASWTTRGAWGHVTPKVGISQLAYNLDAPLAGSAEDAPDAFAAEASLDTGLIFERPTPLGTQTLEPRLYYLYRDADDQSDMPVFDTAYATESLDQLFRDSIYVGGDRLEDANRLSLGLWSRLFSRTSGREILSLGLGQSFYLDDLDSTLLPPISSDPDTNLPQAQLADFLADLRNQTRAQTPDRSNLIGQARWHLSDQWTLGGDLFWDDAADAVERSRLELGYRAADSDNLLTLAYSREDNYSSLYVDPALGSVNLINEDVSQLGVSGHWNLDSQWSLVFSLQEDLENDRNLDRLFGVSYQSCCWTLSLAWRDRLARSVNDGFTVVSPNREKSIVLSFELFRLGGLGRSGTALLNSP